MDPYFLYDLCTYIYIYVHIHIYIHGLYVRIPDQGPMLMAHGMEPMPLSLLLCLIITSTRSTHHHAVSCWGSSSYHHDRYHYHCHYNYCSSSTSFFGSGYPCQHRCSCRRRFLSHTVHGAPRFWKIKFGLRYAVASGKFWHHMKTLRGSFQKSGALI